MINCEACGDDLAKCCGRCVHELCTNACTCKTYSGTQFTTKDNPKRKLTDQQVMLIRDQHNNGMTDKELAAIYNVSNSTIWRIRRGYTHKGAN